MYRSTRLGIPVWASPELGDPPPRGARSSKNSSRSARTEEMSSGQHRDDEANGPRWSSKRETEGRRKRESNQPCATAQTSGCARKSRKTSQNVLDGVDFVRVVRNTYLLESFVIVRFSTNPDWRTPLVAHSRIPLAFCAALICARASAARFLPHIGLFLLILRSLMI